MQTIACARPAATRGMISLADAFVNVARPSRRNLTRSRNGRLCGVLFTARLYPQHKTWSMKSFDLYPRRITTWSGYPSFGIFVKIGTSISRSVIAILYILYTLYISRILYNPYILRTLYILYRWCNILNQYMTFWIKDSEIVDSETVVFWNFIFV